MSAESQRARDLLRRHGPTLAAEARRVLAEVPEAELVGVIAAPGAGLRLRDELSLCSRLDLPDDTAIGLLPRAVVADLVGGLPARATAPPLLPVVVAAGGRLRLAHVPIGAADPT